MQNEVQNSIQKAKRLIYNDKIEDHTTSSSESDQYGKLLNVESLGTSSKLKSASTSIILDIDGSNLNNFWEIKSC